MSDEITTALGELADDDLEVVAHWCVELHFSPRLGIAAWGASECWRVHEVLVERGTVDAVDPGEEPLRVGPDILDAVEVAAVVVELAELVQRHTGLAPYLRAVKKQMGHELGQRLERAQIADAKIAAEEARVNAEAMRLVRSLRPEPDLTGIPPWSQVSREP